MRNDLVDILGGTISAKSQPGHGSSFRFTIDTGPLNQVSMVERWEEATGNGTESKKSTPSPVTLLSARILLCEDGPDNQRLFSFLLKKAGADVTVADNGRIGLEKATLAQEADQPFDLILVDMQMPVLDGYRTTEQLREAGHLGPIIALTAHAMAHDRRKCLDCGCDDYISKPVDRTLFLAAVAQHIASDAETSVSP